MRALWQFVLTRSRSRAWLVAGGIAFGLGAVRQTSFAASACFDYGDAFANLASVFPGEGFSEIVLAGSLAYTLSYQGGERFSVLDVGGQAPTRRGLLRFSKSYMALAVSGDIAAVTTWQHDLCMVDVSDPSAPRLVGQLATTGTGWQRDLTFVGDRVYVADDFSGLVIVDVSDPAQPRLVTVRRELRFGWIEAAGTWLYATDGANFHVLDISNPDAPVARTSIPCPGGHLKLEGQRAYLAYRQFSVVDIADPLSPQLLASPHLEFQVQRLAVAGGRAFGAAGTGGLLVLDLTNGDTPLAITVLDEGVGTTTVAATGDRVFTGTSVGLRLFDARWPQPQSVRLGAPGVVVAATGEGTLAALACGVGGLAIVDLSDPKTPSLVGHVGTDGNSQGVAIAGALAYVADFDAGLAIVDVSDPAQPRLRGRVTTPGRAMAVAVADSIAYVADLNAGLQILAVGDPDQPRLVGNAPALGRPTRIAANGRRAYVLDVDAGVQAVDASDAAAPLLGGSRPGPAYDVAVHAGYVYIATGAGGVEIVDFESSSNPLVIGRVPALGTIRQIALTDRFLFAIDEAWIGFTVYDISEPAAPVLVGRGLVGGEARDVAIVGDRIVLARGSSGITVAPSHCDIEVPVALFDLDASEAIDGTWVRWRAAAGVFSRFDVRRSPGTGDDAAAFEILGSRFDCAARCEFLDPERLPAAGFAYDVIATTADGAVSRLGPVFVAPRAQGASIRVAPNPARGAVQFHLAPADAAPARLVIYDVAGRRVRDLRSRTARGEPILTWSGCDEAGKPVPAGIYVARLQARGSVASVRFLWLR